MNDVVTTFHAALVAETGTGEALESVAGHIYRDAKDVQVEGLSFPIIILAPMTAQPLPATKGSQYVISEGVIGVQLLARVDVETDAAWDDGREAVEDLRVALERVLLDNVAVVSVTNPLGCWHDMDFAVGEGGRAESGPEFLGACACYGLTVACSFRFTRLRAA